MLFRKLIVGIALCSLLLLSACTASKCSIVILEKPNGKGFTIDFNRLTDTDACKLSLSKGDVIQVEVKRESGRIGLTVNGKKGSEPYTGNDLDSGLFTVTVSQKDEYVFRIEGRDAAGKVIVSNLGPRE